MTPRANDVPTVPDHLLPLVMFRAAGGRWLYADSNSRIPYRMPEEHAVLVIGDDLPQPAGSAGPEAFDGPRLRRWLAAMDEGQGCIGVFAGSPVASAYGRVVGAALTLRAGGLIIECGAGTWHAWSHLCFLHAPRALRSDVISPDLEASACAHIRAEGAAPVRFA